MGTILQRYYRAELFPTGHKDEDMLWLDFPAPNLDAARAKVKAWERDHAGYDVITIRELKRKHGKEYPREEPAEYACDYDARDGFRGFLRSLLAVGRAVRRELEPAGVGHVGADDAHRFPHMATQLVERERLGFGGFGRLDHAVAGERPDDRSLVTNGGGVHRRETVREERAVGAVLAEQIEVIGLFLHQLFHDGDCITATAREGEVA